MKKAKEGRVKDDAKANYKPFKYPEINIEKLRQEYMKDGIEYNDEEVKDIAKAFEFIHEICYQIWTQKNITQNDLTLIKNEESNFIYPSEYRRAS